MNGNAAGKPVSFLAEFNATEVLNLLADGAYITDTERRIVFWNDAATGQVRLVRAGHPAPLLFQRGGATEPIGKPGPALGLFQHTHYQQTNEQLAPGDALLLYTDGATELFDREDHELGTEGLLELVRAQARGSDLAGFHLAALKEQLLRFSNAIHLPDDLTLVKLNRLR